MLEQLASNVKDSARAAARAAAFSALGALFALVGTAFLTVALWLLLESQEGALFAATVIGALYCAAGFILMAVGMRGRSTMSSHGFSADSAAPTGKAANTPREPLVQMAEGFAMGMQAGRSARSDAR